MRRRSFDFFYFLSEGIHNMFSHGFMSFAAIGITVACLVVMGTFTLVAYNAEKLLESLESEYEVLAFINEHYTDVQIEAVGRSIASLPNVRGCEFISREEATRRFEERHDDEYLLQDLDPDIFRDRYAVYLEDLELVSVTADLIYEVKGVEKVRVEEDIAGGFIMFRNVAGVVSIALIAILLVVSAFIMSNTIRLTTFDRRDEIAIMKIVGATNWFIRWPFVYEGVALGLLSSAIAFGLQWLLYASVARSIALADTLQFVTVIPFRSIWRPVAVSFSITGMVIGVGGSLMAIRRFLQV